MEGAERAESERKKELEDAKRALLSALSSEGLDQCGVIRPAAEDESADIRSVAVVLLPYFAGFSTGNLSLYCQGKDYHVLVPRYLNPAGEAVRRVLGENVQFHVYADTGPLHDRFLALRAGLGVTGLNQMIINPRYGSFFFVAYLTFNVPLPEDDVPSWKELEQKRRDMNLSKEQEVPVSVSAGCLRCGKCVEACPGKALSEDGTFHYETCLSMITQKTGDLTEEETAILRKEHMVFGCDVCQTVCPMNRHVQETPLREFKEERIENLTLKDVEGLSRKQFQCHYPDRAFTWRGPKVIERNIRLLSENGGENEETANGN